MNKSKFKNLALVVLISFLLIGATGLFSVTRFTSGIHISDSRNNNATGTPVFLVDGKGAGVILELRDGATPVFQVPNGGGLTLSTDFDLNGQTLTWDADANTQSVTSFDNTITTTLGAATGIFHILTGNFAVGNGANDVTLNGEDGYIEGTLEVDGLVTLDGGADFNGSKLDLDADADTSLIASKDDEIDVEIGGSEVYSVTVTNFYFNAKILTLDANQDSSLTADTDDQLDLALGGQDEYIFTAAVLDLGEGTLTRIDLDADGDTSIRSSADDQIDLELGGSDIFTMTATNFYFNAKILDLDADQDTSITASSDDQIDIEIGGSDDFIFTANKFESQAGSNIDMNGTQLILDADADTDLIASFDDVITITLGAGAGHLDIVTGNFKVGDGIPTFTQDGEDSFLEGTVEMATDVIMTAQTSFSVVHGVPITPTGFYQPLISAILTGEGAVSDIAAPTDDTIGKQLELHNINATQVITVDGTGATVECKADIVLGVGDILGLRWNGDDWNCRYNYDNS